jgi:hypothetical protein
LSCRWTSNSSNGGWDATCRGIATVIAIAFRKISHGVLMGIIGSLLRQRKEECRRHNFGMR